VSAYDEAVADGRGLLSDFLVPDVLGGSRPRPREGATALYRKLAAGLLIGDALAVEVAALASWLVLRSGPDPGAVSLLLAVLAPLTLIVVFAPYRLYRIQRMSPAEEFRRIIGAVSVAVVVFGVVANMASGVLLGEAERVPLTAGWLGANWLTIMVLVMGERKVWHRVLHSLRRSGALAMRTVIIGRNEEGLELARSLDEGSLGFDVVGIVSVNGERGPGTPAPTEPRDLGGLRELRDVVLSERIECAFVASSAMRPESMTGVLTAMRRLNVEVRVSANMPEILASRLSVQTIGKALALSLQPTSLSGPQAFVKRAFDVALSALAIAVTSPIWLISAALIAVTSDGAVLYRQQRIGRNGRSFTMFKFRTMVADADRLLPEVDGMTKGNGPLFKLDRDPRLTAVGRLLRKGSIDELPQLVNVIKGDMSLVGPRPMPAHFGRDHYEDWHLQRLEVLPGITGLWQVSGRSDLTFDECVRLDLFYIENWSVAYDLFILLKTIPAVLKGRGAY
jgi:exopolysaccharide biosynthesis polyprenyl glycosylphosphotransferase